MKRVIKNNLLGFILGAIIFGSVGVIAANYAADKVDYKTNKNSEVKTVKDALDDLYSKAMFSNIEYIDNVFTWDSNHAQINYTATKKTTLIAIGNGTSTARHGTTNAVINTTGVSTTLVNGKLFEPTSTSYSTTYIYKIELEKDDTLNFEVYSNQGNTSNNAILVAVK